MKDLHTKPETSVEYRDMMAITKPETQKDLATNQGVRFYVDRETRLMEEALTRTMQGRFNELGAALTDLTKAMESATREIANLTERLGVLELRWYERLAQDLEWDWLHIREWFFVKFRWGSNPFADPNDHALIHIDHYEELKAILEPDRIPDPKHGSFITPGEAKDIFSDDIAPAQQT